MINSASQKENGNRQFVVNTVPIRNGFLRWISWQALFLILFTLTCFSSLLLADYFARLASFIAFGLVSIWTFLSIVRKLNIRADLIAIEKESLALSAKECDSCQAPSPLLIFSLNRLRESLQWYAKGTRRDIFPLGDFYSSQLRREIDLYFSCVTESLFQRYWKSRNERQSSMDDFNNSPGSLIKFNYVILSEWAGSISKHLVGSRKVFWQSSTEISTLKYHFQEQNQYFKKNELEIYKIYEPTVNEFYNRLEQNARSRKEAIFQLLSSMMLLLVGSLLGLFFAGG